MILFGLHDYGGLLLKTILLADYDESIIAKQRDILTECGYEIIGESQTVTQAIDDFNMLRPDLTILDIDLINFDGIRAIKGIKAIDKNALIIMCSKLGTHVCVIESVQLGARDFIVKPFAPERLIEAVKKVIG